MAQNIITLEILKDSFEEWSQELVAVSEISDSMDTLYPKDVSEGITCEQILFDKVETISKVKLKMTGEQTAYYWIYKRY